LKVGSEITDFYPIAGPSTGGTLLTITGTNFSPTVKDNSVTIGTSKVVCKVEAATSTQIKCRIPAVTSPKVDDKGTVSVKLGLTE
jgi:hypothetical protein